MNWLTLVAFSAAGASGAVDASEAPSEAPAAVVAPAEKAPEQEIVLEGVVLPRSSGGFLTMRMEGVHVVLRAYDEKKQPVKFDVDRAVVRLQFSSRSPEQYTLLRSDDGLSLTVGRPIRAPHVFRAFINLFRGDSSEAVESYQASYP